MESMVLVGNSKPVDNRIKQDERSDEAWVHQGEIDSVAKRLLGTCMEEAG